MKILYIDVAIDGHHLAYLAELAHNKAWSSIAALPEELTEMHDLQQYVYSSINWNDRSLLSWVKWMRELSVLAAQENVDIVHFLMGDQFYRYFGLGIGFFQKFRVVSTLHWIRPGKLQQMSLRVFGRKLDKLVVHSDYLLKELQALGLRSGVHIEYPQFKPLKQIDPAQAKAYWGLTPDVPVILSLGGTREDKGVDILIEALGSVKHPFQLLIAGKPETFDSEYIKRHTKDYEDRVKTALRYLTDEEVELAVAACDIVALPYRASFNGASGPLGEGVCRDKCIIGSHHGNLGHTIRQNHLGYTFETENPDDLAKVLKKALTERFMPDETYQAYKASLNPELFVASYQKVYEDLI